MKIDSKRELESIIKEGKVFLYGAGRVGKIVAKWALKNKLFINGFIVTEINNNSSTVLGLDIKEAREVIKINGGIILVTVLEKNNIEICEYLRKMGCQKYYTVTDQLISSIERDIADFEIDNSQLLEWIKSLCGKISQLQCEINENICKKDAYLLWNNEYEKKVTILNWGNVYEREDFKDRFLRLINNLDEESVKTVIRIINRQMEYLNSNERELDLFYDDEKELLRCLKSDFYGRIVKLSPDLYMYKDYFLCGNEFESSVFYYKHGASKLSNIEKYEGGTIIDVGGYVGDSAIVFQELKPGKIITFEALPSHCLKISKNLELNGIQNVIVENCALGNSNGSIQLEVSGPSSTTVNRKGIDVSEVITVPLTTLDEYVEKNNIDGIDLIKVDIEGAESMFLEGAEKTIREYCPTLLLSIYHNEHDFFELKPLIESWNLGYKFQIFKSVNGNITNETLLICERG